MLVPNELIAIIILGAIFFIVTNALSLVLAVDTYRSCEFITSVRVLNTISIGYAAFLFGTIVYGLFRPLEVP